MQSLRIGKEGCRFRGSPLFYCLLLCLTPGCFLLSDLQMYVAEAHAGVTDYVEAHVDVVRIDTG